MRRDAGKLYIMAGLSSKAERHLEEALTWMPEDPETLTLLMKCARTSPRAAFASRRAGSSGGRDNRGVVVSAFGLTDVGRKRRHNEDAYLIDEERGLFVVADGMGGHAAARSPRASRSSHQEYIAATEEEHESSWPFGFNSRVSLEGNRLTTAVEKANEKSCVPSRTGPSSRHGDDGRCGSLRRRPRHLVHVGISRAYLFRDGELRRLTDDHSWVQEQVNAGILSEDEPRATRSRTS